MSTVRTVLDPERQHAADTYVASDRRSVWLVMANVRLDVAAFQVLAAAARPADTADREALLRAEAAYGGDFLEEDAYEEWAVSIREELRADYLEVVRALAALAGREGDRDLAVRSCLRVLEHDAFDEAAHLGLVEAYTAAGRHGEARRAYRVYVGRMAELGVEAAAFPG